MKRQWIVPACVCLLAAQAVHLTGQSGANPRELALTKSKSIVIDSPVAINRVSVADPEIVEAVGVTPTEVVLNGRLPGETSVILWQEGGGRLLFDVTVKEPPHLLEAIREELKEEMAGQDVQLRVKDGRVFLQGTVDDLGASNRAEAIAATLGEPVNLLQVRVPGQEQQILLKVKFASVERNAGRELGANFFSTGAGRTIGRTTTGQFSPPNLDSLDNTGTQEWTLSDALNIFLFRPDWDFGMTLKLLQEKGLLEVLAEPNVLAINGKKASFLAGGEFPFPVVQGSAFGGVGAVTIQWREFGIRLDFRPRITPQGTIRLMVAPEVSALDFANGLQVQGFIIPSLDSRKISTEIELEDGQSFAIAGLMDNRMRNNLKKIPGLGDIPYIGKIFQSQELQKEKAELLVLVTPEVVYPIPAGHPHPELEFPQPFIEEGGQTMPRTPGIESTGRVVATPVRETMPVDALRQAQETLAVEEAPTFSGYSPNLQVQPGQAPAMGPAPVPVQP